MSDTTRASFGFQPTREHTEYHRLKWWHLRKTPIRVLHEVQLREVYVELWPINTATTITRKGPA
jgi:hypothetical protein